MGLDKILNSVLDEIRPTKEWLKELESQAKKIILIFKKAGLNAKIGGSLAKRTILKNLEKVDVDIFVVFKKEEEIISFSNIVKKIKIPGKLKVVHGSRDYFQIEFGKVIFEIIPVLENKKNKKVRNVTDYSLKHVKYISEEIKKNKRISEEIILAKAFFKAQGVYGAESYVRGFSGYSLEVLVIHFGSFIKLLKGIQKNNVIDPKKYFKNEDEIRRELNESKISGPIILVDPTYKYRNVCAGLSNETFDKALNAIKNFLKFPNKNYFFKKEFDFSILKNNAKKNNLKVIEVLLNTDRQEGDIAGTKMRKVFDFISDELIRKQQKVIQKEFIYDGLGKNAKGYLLFEEKKEIEIKGPLEYLEDAVKSFKKSKKNRFFIKDGCYYSKEKINVLDLFKMIIKISKNMGAKASIKIV